MFLIRLSCRHTLPQAEASRRVADLFEKFELLTQAQVHPESPNVLALRGPNVRGALHVHADRIDFELRLGIALSIVGERMRDIVEQELNALCAST